VTGKYASSGGQGEHVVEGAFSDVRIAPVRPEGAGPWQSARSHGPVPTGASEQSPSKKHFPYKIGEDFTAQLPSAKAKITPLPKVARGSYLGPSEAAQHLPEGVRLDLDNPGEGVVELGDGEEYAADDQRQGGDHKRVRHVALKPE
jgi:hypothetical protein